MKRIKSQLHYVCNDCGYTASKWQGKCFGCNKWNTLVEQTKVDTTSVSGRFAGNANAKALPITKIDAAKLTRFEFGVKELDRVLGGGMTPSSLVLLGGEPGIGKSTLLLNIAFMATAKNLKTLYITAEESVVQTKMRALRIGAINDKLFLLPETDLSAIFAEIDRIKPDLIFLDSVQTMYSPVLDSAAGSVSQVREITNQVMQKCKSEGICAFLVGHITKDGAIAGPKLLEHMVDTVLYFESTKSGPYRILRSHKNRFGSTNEIGIFEMKNNGLCEVSNPSKCFLQERQNGKPGSAVAAVIEGTRPILVEVQALCVNSTMSNPKRAILGFDSIRCGLLAAVLEKTCGFHLSGQDLFINIAGGASLLERSADLPVALAIASSLANKALKPDIACFGEIGLSGELRGAQRIEERITEAAQMGFSTIIMPKTTFEKSQSYKNIEIICLKQLSDAINFALQDFTYN